MIADISYLANFWNMNEKKVTIVSLKTISYRVEKISHARSIFYFFWSSHPNFLQTLPLPITLWHDNFLHSTKIINWSSMIYFCFYVYL